MKFEANPQVGDWPAFVTYARAKKNRSKMLEQDGRLDLLGIDALGLSPENVFSDMDIEWELNTHREVFDRELFTNRKGCSLENIKAKLNTKLPVNERLTEEEVFALKPSKKELVTRVKFVTKHRTENIRALLRGKQGMDVFTNVAKEMLEAAPFSNAKDQHHMTEAELQIEVETFLEKIAKGIGEDEPNEGDDPPEEDCESSASESSQRRTLGVRGARFASFTKQPKKGAKKEKEAGRGAASKAAISARAVASKLSRKGVLGSPRRTRATARAALLKEIVTGGSDDEPEEEVDVVSQISSKTMGTVVTSKTLGPTEKRMYDYEQVMAGQVHLKNVNIVCTLALSL